MKCIFLPSILALALIVSGCSSQIISTSQPSATIADTPLPPAPSDLTLEVMRNGQYSLPGCDGALESFQLTDGSYTSGTDPAAEGYVAIHIGDLVAYGDLDLDSVEDATAVLGVNCGGTGVFTYLVALLNNAGEPVFAASVFLDDRPMVNSLSIDQGEIEAEVTIHGTDDAMCCPSVQTRQGYRLFGNNLIQTRWVTWTADNQERAINITAPLSEADVTNPFTVNGEVTVAPFENTLAYRIYIPDGTLVNEFSTMVDSGGVLGAPGTFSQTFDLSNAGITGPVLVQFLDLSAKDGSTLALGAVLVNVH